MTSMLIIGATSAIAESVARLSAARGDRLHLLARNAERLEAMRADLKLRGSPQVTTGLFDAGGDMSAFDAVLSDAITRLETLDSVLIAHGTLPDQAACAADPTATIREIQINGTSTIALLTILANHMETQGKGTIAVISSVAGDRGRQSNYTYGAAKKMVSTFLQGLRNRLHSKGVAVLDIKPGFVSTPMTKDFPKGPLWAEPDKIAPTILKAIDKKKDVLYVPWFWALIMLIIRSIPEFIFKKLSL